MALIHPQESLVVPITGWGLDPTLKRVIWRWPAPLAAAPEHGLGFRVYKGLGFRA